MVPIQVSDFHDKARGESVDLLDGLMKIMTTQEVKTHVYEISTAAGACASAGDTDRQTHCIKICEPMSSPVESGVVHW